MRKIALLAVGVATVTLLSGCGKSGYDRARPDEFAVARQAPLVIPPDFALAPPQPGVAARSTARGTQAETLEALFGANQARTPGESDTLDAAGGAAVDPGIRSQAGDPATNVVDKGQTTRDIVAAPEGDGQDAKTSTPQ